jgi:hypothetical protein
MAKPGTGIATNGYGRKLENNFEIIPSSFNCLSSIESRFHPFPNSTSKHKLHFFGDKLAGIIRFFGDNIYLCNTFLEINLDVGYTFLEIKNGKRFVQTVNSLEK